MTMLLLAEPGRWADDAATEAAAMGLDAPVIAARPRDAVAALAGGRRVDCLILQPSRAGDLLAALIDMIRGEAAYPTRLILVGDGPARLPIPDAVMADDAAGWLGRALAAPLAEPDTGQLDDAELLHALSSGWLRAAYQPIIAVATGRPCGLEALARLHHPTRGTLAPSLFVPQAEAGGLGWTLFRLMTALTFREWNLHALHQLDVPLNINIGVAEILRPDLQAWLLAECAAADLPPSSVVLELTETQPVHDDDALRQAATALAGLGFRLMIDDVGPGMRDPQDLHGMPFEGMKFDKTLVNAARTDPAARHLLTAMLGSARQAGLSTVAEGVEDADTCELVKRLGFRAVQGFHTARPLPATALVPWFETCAPQLHAARRVDSVQAVQRH